ncbi:uncharacterized protein LOC132378920 [Hypanus sabinus]|uniref:uncharacterized protein LOC132378920 n=1 Tax=Hypanus sabinus TaxID=79690 RepID=UPI0028C3945B|nr:uncharacterized protein LOC132378920 [Hypanus sabinus]
MLIKQTMATEIGIATRNGSPHAKGVAGKGSRPIQKHMAENGTILRSLKEQADIHAKKLSAVFNKIDNIQVCLRKNEKVTNSCLAEVTKIWKKLNDLEDRFRRNNVRLVNLPTGAEGNNPRGYLQEILPNWIPALKNSHSTPLEIDRAHKIFSNNTSRPQTMIFRLLRYTDQQAILEGARKAKPILPDGTQLQFFTDYSPGMMQEWQGYKEIRTKLRQKGIDSFLIYLAILRVNTKGMKMLFNSAEEAKESLKLSVLGDMKEDPGQSPHVPQKEMELH